ncbi:MAG: DNA translocase FtsK 4TM domain-containing protein, partial [Rhodothermales bacterium]|nr:DNA translocase FtsK 4TM domain-containing protein [Rhodothermales bacterium]
MKPTPANSRRKPSQSKSESGLVSAQRKKEVLGLILMVLSILIAFAVLSYSESDQGLAQTFSLREALNPGDNRAANFLGLIGAWIAHGLVFNFLGYTVIALPALLFAWGYMSFRNRQPVYFPTLALLIFVAAFVVAAIFGWLGQPPEGLDTDSWSGRWGDGTAAWMILVFGRYG